MPAKRAIKTRKEEIARYQELLTIYKKEGNKARAKETEGHIKALQAQIKTLEKKAK